MEEIVSSAAEADSNGEEVGTMEREVESDAPEEGFEEETEEPTR